VIFLKIQGIKVVTVKNTFNEQRLFLSLLPGTGVMYAFESKVFSLNPLTFR